jgi:hypothetical protein
MGVIGGKIGRFLGHHAESAVSNLYNKNRGKVHHVGQKIIEGAANRLKGFGSTVGEHLGGLLPFKKGGRVKKTGPIYAHKGEFILPKGVKPTMKQMKRVRKRKVTKRKKSKK